MAKFGHSAIRTFGHFETLRKTFDESKPSKGTYIWYQNLGFSLKINIPKHLTNFL